jgi:hypothetical protein
VLGVFPLGAFYQVAVTDWRRRSLGVVVLIGSLASGKYQAGLCPALCGVGHLDRWAAEGLQ